MAFKKGNLYTNEAKTEGIYPNTVYSAIFKDDMSKTLDADLGDLSHYNAQTIISGIDPLYLHLDIDLLWTNASPTSDFAAQTITLEESYPIYLIQVLGYLNSTKTDGVENLTNNIVLQGKNFILGQYLLSEASTATGYLSNRRIIVNGNQIEFSLAKFSANDNRCDATMCKPVKIYGIR